MQRYILLLSLIVFCLPTQAQRKKKKAKATTQDKWQPVNDTLFQSLKWRNVGPFRGGRSVAATGVPGQTDTYYMGSVGGGVWKTTNGGQVWRNVSDGFLKTGSVGALAVAPSDPNVVYVGMGEAPVRGVMTSHGDGVYRSTDAGKSWTHLGLEKVRQISKIRVHPHDPDVVYVAAQGSPHAPTKERGVYRSTDGGRNWELVLQVDEKSGVSDLSMDPNNPRVLYAAFWEHQRLPWKVVSGGPGSSIWKTVDGGENWQKLEKGLPDVVMGKIGVSVSPANSNRVYAIIESDKGGLYRSDDAGKSWRLVNPDRVLRARSWYYMHVFADPKDAETVYVLNAPMLKSTDGGKSFQIVGTPHGDNHDLWIHPDNPQIMINANDGGANISYNGGKSWSTQSNQPTAQFYRVNVDNRTPYYIYGGQQDNSTVAIPNQTNNRGIRNEDFYDVGGCESAYTAFDPDNPNLVYAGCYQGIITEKNVKADAEKDVMAYPYLGLGSKPSEVPYRFNWNAPILVSRHDPTVIYHAGNQLLKSSNRGQKWDAISPDLTRNVAEHLEAGGGPITNEAAGGEVYHTIMYIAEAPDDAQTIWAGSDDGKIHLTRDAGKNWTEITPSAMGEGIVNCIDVSEHDPATAYVAFTRYKFNDFTPHIFITHDYGQSWTDLTKGIDAEAHVRVVRADTKRKGLLYAGTETGLYISYDNGAHWQRFQRNLPICPITDLKVHGNDLVAATQGRAFWVLDDLNLVRETGKDLFDKAFHAWSINPASLYGGPRIDSMPTMGSNPDYGVVMHYFLGEVEDSIANSLKIELLDGEGKVLRSFSPDEKEKRNQLSTETGSHKMVWDLAMPAVRPPKGLMVLGGQSSYEVMPGKYQARFSMGGDTMLQSFLVKADHRFDFTSDELKPQKRLQAALYTAIEELYDEIKDIRQVKADAESLLGRLDEENEQHNALKSEIEDFTTNLDSLMETMVQAKQKTFQDVINFPNQLDAKLNHILNTISGAEPPLTSGQQQRADDLLKEWDAKKVALTQLLDKKRKEINAMVQKAEIPYLSRKQE
ncbi:MAG: glycosyl hydrolase [Bacteroidota bacterium]